MQDNTTKLYGGHTMKTNTIKTNTIPTVAMSVLNHVSKANGWSVKDDAAISAIGTMVRFTAKTCVISNGSQKMTLKLGTEIKPIVSQIIVMENKAKEQAKTAKTPAKADQTNEVKPMTEITPNTVAKNKAAAAAKLAAATKAKDALNLLGSEVEGETEAVTPPVKETKPPKAAKPPKAPKAPKAEKPVVVAKPLVNPAGTSTPVFEELKAACDKTEKVESVIKSMWEEIGKKFNNSISGITTALLAEGLWPARKDAKGNFVADPDGNQVPAGYQAVYKAEKENAVKGVGHYVNTAAAAFGRINMEKGRKEADAKGPKTPPDTPTEKQLNKLLLQLESAAQKLTAGQLKEWLETSKTMQPVLDAIVAEQTALGELG
jgi:hypothetical protein